MFKTEVHSSINTIPSKDWNDLLTNTPITPFIRHEYLHALENSGSVCASTGWTPCHFTVWNDLSNELVAACPAYLKTHSYGEYVFDWAWANAYEKHGLKYYPKLLSAIPFTPVQGTRILGHDINAQKKLIESIQNFALNNKISSIHFLFPEISELDLLIKSNFLKRQSIQFHWKNNSLENPGLALESFDEFLYTLNKKRRNNIIRERKSVHQLGINFEHIPGESITLAQWAHFYKCYSNTYFEHRSTPYLNLNYFEQIGQSMPSMLHMIIAHEKQKPIASSLLFRNRDSSQESAYGRYWGSLKFISNLHFEMAYYQPIDFCIREKINLFEGGAQGEHKIHRGMLPVNLYSAHYLLEPQFYDAVADFLKREGTAMDQYLDEMKEHSPIRNNTH